MKLIFPAWGTMSRQLITAQRLDCVFVCVCVCVCLSVRMAEISVSWFKMPLPFQTLATKDLLLIRLESTWPVRCVCVRACVRVCVCVCVCVCALMLFCRLDWFSVFVWHSTVSHQTTWDSLPPHTHTCAPLVSTFLWHFRNVALTV